VCGGYCAHEQQQQQQQLKKKEEEKRFSSFIFTNASRVLLLP
jgi:hypothetical protein